MKFKAINLKSSALAALLLCTLATHSSQAFIFPSQFNVHPDLSDLAQSQTGTNFNIGLSIQNPHSLSQLYIDGLTFELESGTPSNVQQCVPLPGVNGDYPQFSTGPLKLNTKAEGKFVSIHGTQKMNIQKEAWEMIWIADRPTGSIVCGFHLPDPLIRNDAVLPSGKIFINFRVWTSKGLHSSRNDKMMYERRLAEELKKQKDELEKMNSTPNPIMKAVHFRNAAAANEKVSLMYTDKFDFVPMEDKDVMSIGEDLLVAKEGSIWTTIEEPAFFGMKDTNVFLGRAFVKGLE